MPLMGSQLAAWHVWGVMLVLLLADAEGGHDGCLCPGARPGSPQHPAVHQ